MNATLLHDFTTDMQLSHLSPITIRDRLELVGRLAAWLDPNKLIDANDTQLAQWQRQFARLAPATVDVYVRHVQAFYRWALSRGHITENPSLALIRPRVPKGRPHPVTVENLRVVFLCTQGTLRVVFALAAFAGLRRSEICRLQVADVDLNARTATILGKGDKVRTVPLIEPLALELATHMPRAGHIITMRDGRPYADPNRLSAACRRHLDSLGVPGSLHWFRHAFATQALHATGDIAYVAELLGHASTATTQIYAQPNMDPARLRVVADLAASVLTPARRSLHVAASA